MATNPTAKEGYTVSEGVSREPPIRKRDRVVAHFRRWWWVHLIIFIIVLLVVLLPVVYVGYPRIAQSDVNSSTLNFTSIAISNPTPNSFLLTQQEVIGTSSSFHPSIFAFNASVALATASTIGTPFIFVQVPETKVFNGDIVNVNQTVQLTDGGVAFEQFSQAVLSQPEVSINVFGRPGLKEGALPTTTVTYNKTVTMKGLNGLHGFNVTDFSILLTPLPDGTNMNGTVLLPNPTVMSITMGNLSFALSVNGSSIGNSTLKNVVIRPGDNFFPITSIVNQTRVIDLLLNTTAYPGGILPIDIRGTNSVYAGQELTYFSNPLRSTSLQTSLNVGAALAKLGLNLTGSGGL